MERVAGQSIQYLIYAQPPEWKVDDGDQTYPAGPVLRDDLVLKPLQIRTFVLTYPEQYES